MNKDFNMWIFLLTNLLNGLMAMGLLVLGLKILNYFTEARFKDVVWSEEGVTGGSVVVAAFLLGLSYILGSAAF